MKLSRAAAAMLSAALGAGCSDRTRSIEAQPQGSSATASLDAGMTPVIPLAAPSLPVYGALPEFALTDQHGARFNKDSLRGHVWISDYFFTTCAMACPLLTARMALLQSKLRAASSGVRLLSITIAPATDKPPVLKAYAEKFGADQARWTFLTGETDPLQLAATRGYEQAPKVGASTGNAKGFLALHGQVFELVDGEGNLRGYYDKSDAGIAALLADARTLERG